MLTTLVLEQYLMNCYVFASRNSKTKFGIKYCTVDITKIIIFRLDVLTVKIKTD